MLLSGLPFALLGLTRLRESGIVLLTASRLPLLLVHRYMDSVFRDLFGESALWAFRTSWVSVLLLTRPFSNTLETLWLLLAVSFAARRHAFRLGGVSAFGVFNRVTFPAFALPVGVFALLAVVDAARQGDAKRQAAGENQIAVLGRVLAFVARGAAGFALVAAAHVAADTAYVRAHPACADPALGAFAFTLTPLNNLLYNANTTNLAEHGLHSRFTHLLVNMQLLFSPLWLAGFLPFLLSSTFPSTSSTSSSKSSSISSSSSSLLSSPSSRVSSSSSSFGPSSSSVPQRRRALDALARAIVVCALLLLSVVPHQEARFLMPLVVPVAALLGGPLARSARARKAWLLFNLGVGAFFGFVHQGGLVPGMLALETSLLARERLTCVATYETYMAPRFLLAGYGGDCGDSSGNCGDCGETLTVVDLGGIAPADVSATLRAASSSCQQWALLLPTPAVADLPALGPHTRRASFWPHFSGERPPASLAELALEVHTLDLTLT